MWRNNTNTSFPVLVAHLVPVNLLANYHLTQTSDSTYALNAGLASYNATQPNAVVSAPNHDIDNQGRPQLGLFDRGADEVGATSADLGITKDDGVTSVNPGTVVHYTIVVNNAGPDAATGTVTDTVPAALTGATWTCAGTGCGAAGGSGSIAASPVSLAAGASVTFTLNATVAVSAALSVSNTASVAITGTTTDPAPGNNSATDTDSIVGPRPTLTVLDNFNRPAATTLGGSWTEPGTALRTNGTQAFANNSGTAFWNVPAAGFGAKQAAAFTMANATVNGDSLILKSSGLVVLGVAQNFIRVRYQAGQVVVETTNFFGVTGTITQTGAFTATFASGDTLTALANVDGSVDVWKTTAATTYLGRSATRTTFTAGGLGMQLNSGAIVDNFAGGTVL